MLSGATVTDTSLRHAEQMIKSSQQLVRSPPPKRSPWSREEAFRKLIPYSRYAFRQQLICIHP